MKSLEHVLLYSTPPLGRHKAFTYVPLSQVQSVPAFWVRKMQGHQHPPALTVVQRAMGGRWILRRKCDWDRVKVFARVQEGNCSRHVSFKCPTDMHV